MNLPDCSLHYRFVIAAKQESCGYHFKDFGMILEEN